MRRSKKTLRVDRHRGFGALLAVVALCLPLTAEADPAAKAAVEDTVEKVLEILTRQEWTVAKRVTAIETIVYDRFDFTTISRLVLARNYRKFSSDQRTAFEREFKAYLSRSYGSRLDRYDQENVEVVDQREESRGDVTVRTRVVGGSADGVEIHYRLRQRKEDGEWKVIDVVIEGVSLVSNFRSQFQEVVSEGGPALLLERISEKNEKREAG